MEGHSKMTGQERYTWKRFWCPPDGRCNFGDGGFVVDPGDRVGHFLQPDLLPFENIAEVPCLVLIGERGIGKTFVLEDLVRERRAALAALGGHVHRDDLGAYNTDTGICDGVFGCEEVKEWAGSDYVLEMFLDSLDECIVEMSSVAKLLIARLRGCDRTRLRLRVVCRTAVWRDILFLKQDLTELWGDDRVSVYELVPLRRKDVVLAAEQRVANPDGFMREVIEKDAVPFAFKPITLEMLLDEYGATGRIPGSQVKLYKRACLRLCAARGGRRQEEGDLTYEQQLAVAERIAALTLFGKRTAVSSDLDHEASSAEGVITVSQLIGEPSEPVNGSILVVDRHVIDEVLGTGLFTSRGGQLLGWGHKSYEEFLAAMYLVRHQFAPEQIGDLVFRPAAAGETPHIVPELRDVVVWLAAANPGVMHRVAALDPRALLRKPIADADARSRATLTRFLLELTESGEIQIRDLGLKDRLDVLKHGGLQDQLTPWIEDKKKPEAARRLAIEIAGACELNGLAELITNTALSDDEPLVVRVSATRAAGQIGDHNVMRRLMKLLHPGPTDVSDQLKGYALLILWPQHITAKELFSALTPQKRANYTGPYQMFLSSRLVNDLDVPDVPVALEWARQQGPDSSLSHGILELVHAIMTLAFRHLDDKAVLSAFVQTALVRISHQDWLLGDEDGVSGFAGLSDERRRQIARELVQGLAAEKGAPYALRSSCPDLLTSKDLPWLLEELLAAANADKQSLLAKLVSLVLDRFDTAQVLAVFAATQESAVLKEEFEAEFEPVQLDSAEADQLRKFHGELKDFSAEGKTEVPAHLPLPVLVEKWLDLFESGETDAWCRLNLDMTLSPDSDSYQRDADWAPDITALPGWEAINDELRSRCVSAAEVYLHRGEPRTDEWLERGCNYRPALAGYRAIALLHEEAPALLAQLPHDVWPKWAPVIVAFPEYASHTDDSPMQQLIAKAYKQAPNEVIRAVHKLIDKENLKHGNASVIRKLRGGWDERLAKELVDRVKTDRSLKAGAVHDILDEVLQHDDKEAVKAARLCVPLPAPTDGEARGIATAAATALLAHGGQAGFDSLWPDIQRDPDFCTEVITHVARLLDQTHAATIAGPLNEASVADFYIWVARRFPYDEDPKPTGVHVGSDRESIAFFRDALLNQLCERGTIEAYREARRIEETLRYDWLKRVVRRARETTLSRTWEGVSPGILLNLAKQRDSRLVESGKQLLDVVMASLVRFQTGLRGKGRAVYNLWNEAREDRKKVYRPKDEERLSDRVHDHLEQDLSGSRIVPNREVQVSHGKTDIHVDAVADDDSVVSLVIEVKGCWNSNVKKAMANQLLGDYLRDVRPAHGLYLVGWFLCGDWHSSDYRKSGCPGWSLSKARQFFEEQAKGLSDDDVELRAFVLDATIP